MEEPLERRRHALLVDDHELLRVALARLLRRSVDVTEVASGPAALALLDAAPERYDIILSDLMMAEMDGATLFDAVRRRFPAMARRFVLMTAGAFDRQARWLVDSGDVVVLLKPLRLGDVLRAIEQVERAR